MNRTTKFFITVLLFLATCTAALAQNKTVTISGKGLTVDKVLREVESQTGLSLMYDSSLIDPSATIDADFTNEPVSKVLSEIFGKNVKVSFQGNMAVISQISKTAAQTDRSREIRGTVVDIKSGQPVMFVTVFVKGTTNGTVSDTNGRFSIRAKDGDIIEFSLLGYEVQDITVASGVSTLKVELAESKMMLDDAVVTALGITRDEKSIGYAVSKVESDAINTSVSNNWVGGLEGKVAGLSLESANTGPGGAVRVTLRGENSLNHDNNEALFVIDGVPMLSGMVASSSGSGFGSTDAPIDYGNGIGDINPEEIESVTVLKGPAATALYGSQAANGAIVITTKSGHDSNRKFRVEFSSHVIAEKAGYWPDLQTEYGDGNGNEANRKMQSVFSFWNVPANMSDTGEAVNRLFSRAAFGPKFNGQMLYTYDSAKWKCEDGVWSVESYERKPWEAVDWYKGAFETGFTTNNTVALSWNPDRNTSVRFSLSDRHEDWILPNTGYSTQMFTLSLNQQAGRRVKLNAKINYYRKDSDNLPTTGYSTASPMYALMFGYTSIPVTSARDDYMSGRMAYFLRLKTSADDTAGNGYTTSYQCDNLYMMMYENLNTMDRDRVFGNASVDVKLTDHMDMMLRSGIDLAADFRTQRKASYSYTFYNGYYKEQTIKEFLSNNDLLFNYGNNWGNWDLKATLGGNIYVNNLDNVQVVVNRLDEPNVFILQNSMDPLIVRGGRRDKKIYSVFGSASLSYKGMVFVDVTGRNDWSSTLPAGNRSYFYPSVSASVLLNKMFKMSRDIDLLKLRASWANVGNDTKPYNTTPVYNNSNFPGSYIVPATLTNPDLRPENVASYEAGIQLAAFKKRISADIAVYKTITTDQIIAVPSDYITGAHNHYINAGMVSNTGIEFTLGGTPISTKNFNWTLNFTAGYNKNMLDELAPGVELWQLNSNTVGNNVYIYAYPGSELGHIYGQGYRRAPEGAYYIDENGRTVDVSGQKVIDKDTGNPVLNGTTPDDLFDFGSIYPDWKGGLATSLRMKDFSLTMNFSYSIGGIAYSITHYALSFNGKLTNSLEGRYDGLLLEGVNDNGDGTYSPNTTIIRDVPDYYQTYKYSRNNVEENVFDTSYLKLKDARLEYNLPSRFIKDISWLTRASLGIYATNLFCITNFPMYDPEVATLTGASISRGIEACAYPMTRTYGVNLKMTF